jgi:hypothetical protein
VQRLEAECFTGYRGVGTIQVGKLQSGDEGTWPQETLMPLQRLRTADPDELAEGFRQWDLRFRQFGGGSFQGELAFLQAAVTEGRAGRPTGSGWFAAPRTTCEPAWESRCPCSTFAGNSR